MSSNETEHINLPWLCKSILKTALTSEEDDDLQVTSYAVTPATAAGDNYASEMYRVKVLYTRRGEEEKKSLVMKVIPSTDEMAKILLAANIFVKEHEALSSVIPSMFRLLEEAAPSQFQAFSPKCYYRNTNPEAIIMEDLKENGFMMAKRTVGLDMKHSILVIRKIAQFHACSAVLHEINPEVFKAFDEKYEEEKYKESTNNFFGTGLKNVAKELESWPDHKHFATKLYDLGENVFETLLDMYQRDDKDFNVLRHGDLWLNNMMFLYSQHTGEVEDVRFVDFQLCNFSSPAIDIIYFLYTSVSVSLMDEHSKLIEEYLTTLTQTLVLLGYGHLAPSMEQFQKQIEKKGTYAVIVACTVLTVVLADPNYIPDMELIMKDGISVHFSELFINAMKKYLLEFERKGWI